MYGPSLPVQSSTKQSSKNFWQSCKTHQEQVFGELPVHYENVGHWLQTDTSKNTVDVLLDFK